MSEKVIGALDEEVTKKLNKDYAKDKRNPIIRHALSRANVDQVIYVSEAAPSVTNHFSVEVKTLPVTNQRQSGRCWIFAGLNVLREIVATKLGLKKFELSQNYISLYDKIEKANFALESCIKLADKDSEDRVLQFILFMPVSDGGQWDMFVNLVNKYGLVPQDAFPETAQSNSTRALDQLVNAAIRKFAADAHKLYVAGKAEEIRPLKDEVMGKIYTMFLNAFGVPPKKFDFQYEDEKGKYHIVKNLTPKSFFEKYVGSLVDDYQSLINSPTKDKPYGKNFTVDFLGNVVEGKPINHLNVEMERMKEAIIAQLKDGLPVWFGSDVGFYRTRELPYWDSKSFDYETTFGIPLEFSKEDMLDYRHSAMNHAMVITGVDLVGGVPQKWKIENSWGGDNGIAGYYIMSKEFFDTFVYQAVVLKKYLTAEEVSATEAEPTHLKPWDPMGTLAD
ncbi:MAG: C1 family peptidase [Bacillota bacterium]|nr:C1 family peptidase [Bacillota bacterium]